MTCRDLTEFLMHYLDGELPDEQRTVFEAHLKRCPPCEAYLQTYQACIQIIKSVHPPSRPECVPAPPEELVQEVFLHLSEKRASFVPSKGGNPGGARAWIVQVTLISSQSSRARSTLKPAGLPSGPA